MGPFEIAVRDAPTGPVLHLSGDLDHSTAPRLRERLPTLVLRSGQRLVLDLGQLSFCDSSGIAALIAAHHHAAAGGATVALAAVPANTLRVLHTVGLDQVFPVHADADAATAPRPARLSRTAPRNGPPPAMPQHWTARAETAADRPAVREILLAAFPTPAEAGLVDALRADPDAWIDGLSLVAVDEDDRPAGHALLTRCHIGEHPALCLAPVAVRPERQRAGAGAAVVRAALDAARRADEPHVVVLGHPGYYPRFGFGRASAHGIRLTIDVPDEALMALTLDPGRPLPAGTVRYAAPFGI
ncbi:hypothetical protein GCM10010259_03220 [Streptomyces daghestanicus]|jgi:anti-anti-sigma factor|uniref:Anti-sigma factor antagonist n=4 Tax=Streptomyces TaxID=1883 RepID=A0ABT9LR52_STRGD|nr:anti-anti-sigma factor [Streptomyces griseoviridis]GGS64455.1 hypothetical protein GCM10010238_61770 [Streptomyces niveoruber]GGS78793.1 hypothetical protein GCM10010240_10040 [Streptomyces griseoviridis]GGU16211.1 hypothetical protein GCM10010259_03220 [Streptomyces daghestanicus]GHI35303.1 hypothetical protein Sdagh_70330 [Streptomyces daghestanicus]